MPRSKGKSGAKGAPKHGGQGHHRSNKKNGYDSDDDSLNDTASVMSMNSERGGSDEGGENGNNVDGDDDSTTLETREALQEKITVAVDSLSEKSATIRTSSLNTLITILGQHFVPELVLGIRETLRDGTEKLLKRGSGVEKGLAATLASVTALLVGAGDMEAATGDFGGLQPSLQTLVIDHTAPVGVRVKSCEALCLGAFLAESPLEDLYKILGLLEPLFGVVGGAPDNDGPSSPSKTRTPKSGSLASAAIAGWALLLTVIPPETLATRAGRWVTVLQGLLDGAELEVRLSAGEAVALLVEVCELGAEQDSDEDGSARDGPPRINMRSLISKLRELSTQSHKYQAKRDRRQQRHSFRDYLHAVEDGEGPGLTIKFGCGEVLEVDSWVKKRQYDAICQVLGSGMNRHLVENHLVRQILELGPPKPTTADGDGLGRSAKSERQFLNQANFKARCVARGKSRDQRMAALVEF